MKCAACSGDGYADPHGDCLDACEACSGTGVIEEPPKARNCDTCVWYEDLHWIDGWNDEFSFDGACHLRPERTMVTTWHGCRFHEEGPPVVVNPEKP